MARRQYLNLFYVIRTNHFGYFSHFFIRQTEFRSSHAYLAFPLKGDEVYVCMWHFGANDHHSDPLASNRLVKCFGNFFCKEHQASEGATVQIKEVVHLLFRYDEGVPFCHRVDIEEGDKMLRLCHFVARDFSVDDAGKNGGHDFEGKRLK